MASTRPSDVLTAYVPRLIIDWLRHDPSAIHRELDATLVFVDISGFTALTERLARKGKIGAELMRDTLDGVFRALLDEAYDWGAGLLKWGGDALLLLFDGPDHEQRACRAAWEMQRTIDRVGKLHLSSGTLTLRMSVGIGTGAFQFFLTGSVHRELLIAGPAMTETLHMEAIADAGEIGMTPTLAARLDPACVGPMKDHAILLVAPPQVERHRAPPVGDTSSIDIASCIPVAVRAHLLLKKSEPEHRTITAAFIDLMDTDRLLEELGPAALGEALDVRIRQVQEAALAFDVPFYETDVGKSSVKALLTAGAPSSTGHDEERMLRTLRRIMEQPGIVPVRIGVNTGKVFTGDFGPSYRRAYRVFGDAINTAARVMSKADAGQILSTEIVLNRSRTVFETTPIEPFMAKGKAQPVRASIVGPVSGMRQDDRGALALTGRDEELRVLLDATDATRSGNGALVEIVGEAGMGKTRLLDELVARSPDFRVLRTRCEEYEAATPYFPFRSIMRDALELAPADDTAAVGERLATVVAGVDPNLVPWIPLLGILLGLDLPPSPETAALDERFLRERLAEVTLRFLVKKLPGPTLLTVEDCQHIDESSRDLLARLFAARETHRAMLILTHQGGDRILATPEHEVERCILVKLEPLAPEALEQLVELATEDDPVRPHEASELVARSGGNVMFLLDLVGALQESGSLETLPDSIESLIAGEIDRLAPTDRMIVRYAAVLGARFERTLLAAAIRGEDLDLDDQVWDRLASILRPEPDGTLRFESSLARDAAYEGLPYRRRRALHARVGETIESHAGESVEEEVPTLALHFHEAQRWDKTWHYARIAGDRAMKIHAIADASRFYRQALTAGRRLRSVHAPELAALYERLSDAFYLLGRYDDADRSLKAARRLLHGQPIATAPLAIKQAVITSRTGQYRRTNLRVAQAIRSLDGQEGPDAAANRARLMVMNAGTRFLENRRAESIRWAREAEREARLADAKDALAQAYKLLDMALKESGQLEQAVYSGRALELYEELGDLRNQALILNNQGIIAQERSAWDEALDLYRRSLAIFDATGDRSNACLASYNIAEILSDQGRLDEAEALLRDVLRVWRSQGATTDVADARRELGKLFARRGEFESAAEQLGLAHAEQVRAGKAGEALHTAVRIAELEVLRGAGEGTIASIEDTIQLAGRTEGGTVFLPILSRLRAVAIAQDGRLEEAEALLDDALVSARRRGELYETALLLDALVAVRAAAGLDVSELAAQRDAEIARLGIVAIPPIRLASGPEVSPAP